MVFYIPAVVECICLRVDYRTHGGDRKLVICVGNALEWTVAYTEATERLSCVCK